MADQLELDPQDCVIIHDDIHLNPGVVRNRMSGSSGGHRGVQSIIAAFQSEDVRRVKIGVGLPTDGKTVTRYVLTPFKTAEHDTIEKACRQSSQPRTRDDQNIPSYLVVRRFRRIPVATRSEELQVGKGDILLFWI